MSNRTEKHEVYTNAFYFVSGLASYLFFKNFVFFVLMTVLCCASYLYHWYKKESYYTFDWFAMVLVLCSLCAIIIDTEWAAVVGLVYAVVYCFTLPLRREPSVYMDIGVPSLFLASTLIWKSHLSTAILVLSVFALALFVRLVDNHKNTRDRYYDSAYHAAWHLITAIGFFLICYFYL